MTPTRASSEAFGRHGDYLPFPVDGNYPLYLAADMQLDEVSRQVIAVDCAVLLTLLFFGSLWLWPPEALRLRLDRSHARQARHRRLNPIV